MSAGVRASRDILAVHETKNTGEGDMHTAFNAIMGW
jgi:hypothetical protein